MPELAKIRSLRLASFIEIWAKLWTVVAFDFTPRYRAFHRGISPEPVEHIIREGEVIVYYPLWNAKRSAKQKGSDTSLTLL
jgi:hypothetical protein